MNNLELNNLNLVELSEEELIVTDGGDFWSKLYDYTIGYVVGEVIDGVGRGMSTPCKPCPSNCY